MNRKFLNSALLLGTVLLTGCLKSESNDNNNQEYVVTKGAYIVDAGNPDNGKDGKLYYIDYSTNTATPNATPIGLNPSDVMVYGNKVYVVGSGSNAIYVFNKNTQSLIDKILTVDEMGEEAGVEPRYASAYGSNVYVSTHGGYVAVVDTASLTVTNKFKVGSYPEGLGVGVVESNSAKEASLYVACSDNGNGNGSLYRINLGSGSVTEIVTDKVKNPQRVVVSGSTAFVLDYGNIDSEGNQKDAGVYMVAYNSTSSSYEAQKLIENATGMTAGGSSIVTFNYPKGSSNVTYKVCNLYYNTLNTFSLSGDSSYPITNPSAICIDPNAGYLLIANPGYVNMYDGNGNFAKSFNTGDNPTAISYSYGTAIYNAK